MQAHAAINNVRLKIQVSLTEIAIENIRDRYREQLYWEGTVLDIIEHIVIQTYETNEEVVAQLTAYTTWVREYNRTRTLNKILREIIVLEDPSMLPYMDCTEVEEEDIFGNTDKVLIHGGTDDCRDITYQWAAAQPTRTTVVPTYAKENNLVKVEVIEGEIRNPTYDMPILTQDKHREMIESLYRKQRKGNRCSENPWWTVNKEESKSFVEVPLTFKITRTNPVITTELKEIPGAVESAGPEYYYKQTKVTEESPVVTNNEDNEDNRSEDLILHYNDFSHVAKKDHQLKGTNSDYESTILRTPRYADGESFKMHGPTKPLGKLLLGVMKIVWSRMDQRSIVSYITVHTELGPQRTSSGYIRKARDPYHSLPEAMMLLKKNEYVKFVDEHGMNIEKKGVIDPAYRGDIYLKALVTGPGVHKDAQHPVDAYTMRMLGVIDHDVTSGSYRDTIETQKYMRYGEWHIRIGVLMNPNNVKMPLFVADDWEPDTEYENYQEEKIDRYETWSRVASGGFLFKNSAQLHPDKGTDYDPTSEFSIRTDWSQTIKAVFLARLRSGNLSQKWVVTDSEDKKHRFSQEVSAKEFYESDPSNKSIREPITTGGVCLCPFKIYKRDNEGNITGFDYEYKRQAWMRITLPKGSFKTEDTRRIVLFADILQPKGAYGKKIKTTGAWLSQVHYK
jgi:hypothetical protein